MNMYFFSPAEFSIVVFTHAIYDFGQEWIIFHKKNIKRWSETVVYLAVFMQLLIFNFITNWCAWFSTPRYVQRNKILFEESIILGRNG